MSKKGIPRNGGQTLSTFAQGFQVPSITFKVFFRIGR